MISDTSNNQLVLNVQEPYYSFIKSGKKVVEGRLGKSKYSSLKPGDLIKINDLEVEVTSLRSYPSFGDMLTHEGIERVIPDAKSLEEAVDVYYRFYKKADEERFGVVGISIKLKN